MRWKQTLCLMLAALLCGCGAPVPTATPAPAAAPAPQAAESPAPTQGQPGELTLRQKVGQLFLVRPDALDPAQTQAQIDDPSAKGAAALTDAMRQTLEAYPVGGVVQFAKNITGPEQIAVFNAELQAASGLPLWIAVDEEGGTVARLANHPAFDLPRYASAAAVGQGGDPEAARGMGETIGTYLAGYGFNLDFAPVADVNTNPANPIIGARAFSSDPAAVGAMAAAMADGLNRAGVLPTYKHFPGHGDTAEDSHLGLATTQKDAQALAACEWLPYLPEYTAAAGSYAVMVGHIAVPAVTGDDTPASLSPAMVEGVLRGQLGFDGLVITDSLAMQAVTERYSPADAAVLAVLAGCDLLLMPGSLQEAFDAVLAAVQDGTIPEERLDESVGRILAYKRQYLGA